MQPARPQHLNPQHHPCLTTLHSPYAAFFNQKSVPSYSDDEDDMEHDAFAARNGYQYDQAGRQQQHPLYHSQLHHNQNRAGGHPGVVHRPAAVPIRGWHAMPTIPASKQPHTALAAAAATQPFQAVADDIEHQQLQCHQPAQSLPHQRPTSRNKQQVKVQLPKSSQAAADVAVHHIPRKQAPQQQQQQQTMTRPATKLSRSEAATIIQSWWRMKRLARQQPAIRVLAAAAAQLQSTRAKFEQYKADSSVAAVSSSSFRPSTAHLSHKQYLELNELAMRMLLQLDATPCGVPELRAVRKRLTAAAISLLDEIQGAYSAAVHCSMEVTDDVVREAVQNLQKSGAAGDSNSMTEAADVAEETAAVVQVEEQEVEDQQVKQESKGAGEVDKAAQHQQQQRDCIEFEGMPLLQNGEETAVLTDINNVGDQNVVQLPSGVRVVLVYPGSHADAATQTDL